MYSWELHKVLAILTQKRGVKIAKAAVKVSYHEQGKEKG